MLMITTQMFFIHYILFNYNFLDKPSEIMETVWITKDAALSQRVI